MDGGVKAFKIVQISHGNNSHADDLAILSSIVQANMKRIVPILTIIVPSIKEKDLNGTTIIAQV